MARPARLAFLGEEFLSPEFFPEALRSGQGAGDGLSGTVLRPVCPAQICAYCLRSTLETSGPDGASAPLVTRLVGGMRCNSGSSVPSTHGIAPEERPSVATSDEGNANTSSPQHRSHPECPSEGGHRRKVKACAQEGRGGGRWKGAAADLWAPASRRR